MGTVFGKAPEEKKTGGGFAFGQASQFGGAGGLFGAASAAGGLGGGAAAGADDPYNIPIDLTKIKRTAQPAKTFEEKSSAEKIKTMQEISKENQATGATSIMKRPGEPKKASASVSFGQCLIYEYDKDNEASTVAKRVDSKDISDMRDEKTKIRDLLQAKENEQVAEIQRLRAMMNKATNKEDAKAAPSPDKFKSSAKDAGKLEDSIGESQSLSQSKGRDKQTESYDTDTFEDQSASHSKSLSAEGSGKKHGLDYWAGRQAADASASVSTSKEASGKAQVLSANAMEEYMRR